MKESIFAARGAAASVVDRERVCNCSFRIVSSYDAPTDSVLTRFDVVLNGQKGPDGKLVSGDQFNLAMHSSPPGMCDLFLPDKGVLFAQGWKGNAAQLASVFRGLANSIDEQIEADIKAGIGHHT